MMSLSTLFHADYISHVVKAESQDSLVVCDDCLHALKEMQTGSVDLVFADPPYNINKNFGNNKDKWKSQNQYVDWCKEWITECMRVLKDDGTMYFMTSTQNMPYLDVFVSEKYHVLSRIVWTYDSSGVQARKMYGSLYEPILMLVKSADSHYVFNASDILVEAKTGAQRKLIDYRKEPPEPYNCMKLPGNVWTFSRVRYKMAEYENHPTQKPEAMLEWIIKASSHPGAIVLDPFSGSFTTSAVAHKLGRKSIGIELNQDYFEIGIRRTEIDNSFQGKPLVKVKVRKTKALSKNQRNKEQHPQLTLAL